MNKILHIIKDYKQQNLMLNNIYLIITLINENNSDFL